MGKMKLGRRRLPHGAVAVALTAPFAALYARRLRAAELGPLVPDPEGIVDLPEGFSYRVLEAAGDDMSDGYRVPGARLPRPGCAAAFRSGLAFDDEGRGRDGEPMRSLRVDAQLVAGELGEGDRSPLSLRSPPRAT